MAKYRKKKGPARPIAIACSDIHLSHTPPISRSAEPDWYGLQRRYLDEIKGICDDHGVPLLIAGDLFHTPNPPPALINLAIQHLPQDVYAVAGQHDLFHHNPESFAETAYGTLVLGERIAHVTPDGMRGQFLNDANIYGASWGQELKPAHPDGRLQILLAHKFCYFPGDNPFPGVDPNQTAWDYADELIKLRYDVAFFGDHHHDFIYWADGVPLVVNCGSVILRPSNERDRMPKVYKLFEDGTVESIPLKSVEQDVWLDEGEVGNKNILPSEVSEFVQALRDVHDDNLLSFEDVLLNYILRHRPSEAVRVLLLKSIGRYNERG